MRVKIFNSYEDYVSKALFTHFHFILLFEMAPWCEPSELILLEFSNLVKTFDNFFYHDLRPYTRNSIIHTMAVGPVQRSNLIFSRSQLSSEFTASFWDTLIAYRYVVWLCKYFRRISSLLIPCDKFESMYQIDSSPNGISKISKVCL